MRSSRANERRVNISYYLLRTFESRLKIAPRICHLTDSEGTFSFRFRKHRHAARASSSVRNYRRSASNSAGLPTHRARAIRIEVASFRAISSNIRRVLSLIVDEGTRSKGNYYFNDHYREIIKFNKLLEQFAYNALATLLSAFSFYANSPVGYTRRLSVRFPTMYTLLHYPRPAARIVTKEHSRELACKPSVLRRYTRKRFAK